MGVVGVAILASFLGTVVSWVYRKMAHVYRLLTKIQGPAAFPLLGNFHQLHIQPDEFFEQAQGLAYMLHGDRVWTTKEGESVPRIVRVWISGMPFVMIYGAEECEAVLGSMKMLNKPLHYGFLSAWIGEGLLISKPDKWRPRRKLLTPTFHYDILKDFVGVYNRHAQTLVQKLRALGSDGNFHDIFHTVSLCTLDVICEAALGVGLDAQNRHTDYLDAVFNMKYIVHQRMVKPVYYLNFMFDWFGAGREQKKWVKILHDFTSSAIAARKKLADEAGGVQNLLKQETQDGRRRMAFLDLMLDMNEKGELSMEGIQEEVDTFTFEGHDTTSASMNWFLHLMGTNPHIQARVQKEVDEVMGRDVDATISYDQLGRLPYLEACIKETLRLYPSVPLIARQCIEDFPIQNTVLPAGTNVVVLPSMVHKDPRYWDDPEVFRPERFIDEQLKHPYAYIPFSAGSRNCIGQRFALMEEKCILALIMRHLTVKSELRTDQMRVAAELIIRPMYGNSLKLRGREFGDYDCTNVF